MLREATTGDCAALSLLARRAGERGWSEMAIAEEVVRLQAEVLVLEDRSGIVGWAIVWVVLDEASLLLIAVDPRAARRGHGRRLLRALEARAAERGATRMHLEVRRSNLPARAFYAALGYAETGGRDSYYADGEDAILMARSIGCSPGGDRANG
jgi:[ribosomal protein S18]-alanine N-acetyltransferase